jgi:hypothetical protein
MEYAVKMGSSTMMYIPSFIYVDSLRHSKVVQVYTQTTGRFHKPTIIFFKIKKMAKVKLFL